MTTTRQRRHRKRCSECRHWFHPAHTAEQSQKTCSRTCREKRRRKQARRRRKRDLEGYRADERRRQADSREDRRLRSGDGSNIEQMSRTILSAEEAVLRDEIIGSWDRMQKQSRARFERRLGNLLGGSGEKLRQSGTAFGDCHAPP